MIFGDLVLVFGLWVGWDLCVVGICVFFWVVVFGVWLVGWGVLWVLGYLAVLVARWGWCNMVLGWVVGGFWVGFLVVLCGCFCCLFVGLWVLLVGVFGVWLRCGWFIGWVGWGVSVGWWFG